MTEQKTILNKWQILSGSWLKMIAIVTMLIDHLTFFVWSRNHAIFEPLFALGHKQVTLYFILRGIGRLAFPIFAFLIVEGFIHTHDRKKYGRNLLLFALLSELPWNLVHSGTWLYPTQNVLFTLFLGFLGLCAIEHFRTDKMRMGLSLIGLLGLSILLRSDYGCSGYGFILFLYMLRQNRLLQAVIGSCILGSRWVAGLAFIPINMYNGQRGFIGGGKFAKYLFYLFYPLHLLCIYLFILLYIK